MGRINPAGKPATAENPSVDGLGGVVPSQIGHYRLLRMLGRGGMGVVYEAIHLHLKRQVAIKLLLDSQLLSQDRLQRFDREIEAIGRLRHPHVVVAHDAGTDASGHRYLVMEYIDGRDLQVVAHAVGKLPLAAACDCIRQAALGLAYAHECGCIHRDIKPSNLLLDRQGVVRISDLGLARLQESPSGNTLTGTGQVLGTVDYMSPEQAQADRSIDSSSDIYSLGCTFYRLLSGRVPYDGPQYDSLARKLLAHVREPLPQLGEIRGDVPPEVLGLLGEMTAKDRATRPTAAQVAARLAPYVEEAKLVDLLHDLPSEITAVGDANTPFANSTGRIAAISTKDSVRLPSRKPLWASLGLGLLSLIAVLVLWRPWESSGPPPQDSSQGSQQNSQPGLLPAVPLAESKFPTSPPPEAPREPFFEDMLSTDIQPAVAYPLLNKAPQKLFWPVNPLAQVNHSPDLKQVTASCTGAGFLLLGSAPRVGFTLQMDIFQNRWASHVGVFFGLQPMAEPGPKGERQWQVQGLFLNDRTGLRDADKIPLSFTRAKWIIRLYEDGTSGFLNHDLVGAYLPPAGIKPKQLELTISKYGLSEVRWGGDAEPFADVCGPEVNQQFAPADYCGGFGIYIRRTEGTFRNARITFDYEPFVPPSLDQQRR